MKAGILMFLTAIVSLGGCSQGSKSIDETLQKATSRPVPVLDKETMAFNPARIFRNVEYAKPDDKPLRLDVYMSEDQSQPAPAIIWLHGGGWRGGDKGAYVMGRWLTKFGYTLVAVQYRLTGRACFPAQIHDCKAAVRFMRANADKYNIDPARIGVMGSSAGAHLGLLLATSGDVKELEGDLGNADQSSRVQAAVSFAGPTDLAAWYATGVNYTADTPDSIMTKFLGGPFKDNKDVAKAASPTTHISSDDPPFLLVHGRADSAVAISQAELMVEKLTAAGVKVEFMAVRGAGHGQANGRLDANQKVLTFFEQNLR